MWLTFGEPGRQRFRDQRRREIATIPGDRHTIGCDDYFHDGSKALQCVGNVATWIDRDGRRCDNLTPSIVQYVLSSCLIASPEGRPEARNVRWNLRERIFHISTDSTRVPSSPSDDTPGKHRQHNRSISRHDTFYPPLVPPSLSLRPTADLYDYKEYRDTREITASPEPIQSDMNTETITLSPRAGTTRRYHDSIHPVNALSTNEIIIPIERQHHADPSSHDPVTLSGVIRVEDILAWREKGKKTKMVGELPGWGHMKRTLSNRDYVSYLPKPSTTTNTG